MKAYLLSWSFMRLLRLVLGGIILVQGILSNEIPYAVIGGLLMLMAIANIGCNGGACATPMRSYRPRQEEKVEFEEVSSNQS